MDGNAAKPPEKAEELLTTTTKSGSISGETSRPLVPLVPAQRRPSRWIDLGIKRLAKARQGGNEILKPIARHAPYPWLKDQDIRARHSAPGNDRENTLGAELRESKSAPDLREPVLAAIRGLQDGSLQVDFRTRARIAHAARKVLQAREVQRRAHQGIADFQGTDSAVSGVTLETLASKPSRPTSGIVQEMLASMPLITATASGGPESEFVPPQSQFVDQDLVMEDQSLTNLIVPQHGHHTYPFTVTTGVPQFPQDGVTDKSHTANMVGKRSRSLPGPSLEQIDPKS